MNRKYYLAYVIFYLIFMISCQEDKTRIIQDYTIENDTRSNIVGTWKLIEYANLNEKENKWEYPYGKVKGYFTYTKNNIVNLNLSNEIPMGLSRDSIDTQLMTYNTVFKNAVGYFGKYSIDYEKSIITHHVEGGSLPWYIGTDQKRPFYFEGDTLVIGYKNDWIRKLIKVD